MINNNKISTYTTESNHDIRIKLFEPVVKFRGDINESVGSLLRGEIRLKLKKPIKITCIELKFSGKAKIFRPNAFDNKHTTKIEIISKNVNFLRHSTLSPIKLFSKSLFLSRDKRNDFTTFSSGIHTFPFEIHLPGSLPESIMTEFGSIQYKLKFKIDHVTTFRLKTFQSVRKIEILRIIIPDYINSNGIELSRNHNRMIDYQLSIPKKSFSLGESIPINFKITPLIKKLKLHSIETTLVQKITYKYIKNDNKIECIRYSDNNKLQFDEYEEGNGMENLVYEKELKFDLSKCNNLILHHSVETPLIKIKHELRFSFLLSVPKEGRKKKLNGRIKSKLCFNVGINLSSCLVKRDSVDALPKYDDISFYCSCHPKYQRIARFVLGDSFREDGRRCSNLSCNFADDNKPPRYIK